MSHGPADASGRPVTRSGLGRALVWSAAAAVLLSCGFLFFVFLASRLASGDADAVDETRRALVVYARIVWLKGLLPQLAVCLLLFLAAERPFRLSASGRPRVGAALFGCALLAGAVALPLLTVDAPGWPGVVFQGPGNVVATLLEMSAAVTAAAWLARWRLYSP